jgi:hypothetical protein
MWQIKVDSDTFSTVGYDAVKEVLELGFRTGGAYQYFGVSKESYQQFMSADSLSRFFDELIKDQYESEQVR